MYIYTYIWAFLVAVVQLLSHGQLFATLWIVALQAPLSMGFPQAKILEWVAVSFSRAFSRPRDQTQVSGIAGGSLTTELPRKPIYMYSLVSLQ